MWYKCNFILFLDLECSLWAYSDDGATRPFRNVVQCMYSPSFASTSSLGNENLRPGDTARRATTLNVLST